MSNFSDSKRISTSDLYKENLFDDGGVIVISWRALLGLRNSEFEDSVVIEKIKNEDKIKLGYILIDSDDLKEKCMYSVELTRVHAKFGGFKYYFICPLTVRGISCGRRVAVLYKPDNEIYFGCRYCHQIKYPTQLFNQKHSAYTDIKRHIIEKKIESLEETIVRPKYKGKNTQKQDRLEKLYKQAKNYPCFFYSNKR